jgi:hypothetical protein
MSGVGRAGFDMTRRLEDLIEREREKVRKYLYIKKELNGRHVIMFVLLGFIFGLGVNFLKTNQNIQLYGYAIAPSWCYDAYEKNKTTYYYCSSYDECDEYCWLKYNENSTTECDESGCWEQVLCPEKISCYQGVQNCRQYIFETCRI